MTSVITFAPIATQLARSVSLDALFPRGSVEDALRDHRKTAPDPGEVALPDDIQPFFGHYCVVTRAAVQLLGAPAFGGLARFHDDVEDDPTGTLTLEGALAHISSLAAEPLVPLVAVLRRAMPPLVDEQAGKRAAADLPLPLIAAIIELRANPPLPELVNTSGDPLELITGHYRVREHARVVASLPREFLENDDGSYSWLDEAGTSLARLELSGSTLRVRVNSQKKRIAEKEKAQRFQGLSGLRGGDSHAGTRMRVRAARPTAGHQRRLGWQGLAKPLICMRATS